MSPSIQGPTGSHGSARRVLIMALVVFVTMGAVSCSWFGEHSRLAMQTFNEYYGTEGQRLDDCAVCHTSGRSLNEYGKALRVAIPVTDSDLEDDLVRLLREALASIEGQDSDGDGFANGVEIRSGTFPGDGADMPSGNETTQMLR